MRFALPVRCSNESPLNPPRNTKNTITILRLDETPMAWSPARVNAQNPAISQTYFSLMALNRIQEPRRVVAFKRSLP